MQRISTGNPEADLVLGGGFPANSINILMGEPGTGKTLFVEQLMFANADGDRPILYLSTLSEPLAKVITYVQRFPFFDEKRLGTSVLYDEIGGLLSTDGLGALIPRLRELIESVQPKIIVIDSLKAIHDLGTSVVEVRRMISDMAGLLSAFATTSFLVGEYSEADVTRHPEFAVADGIVEFARFKHTAQDERFMRVSKLRGSGYREGLHAFRLTDNGFEIYPRLVSPAVPENYTVARERLKFGVDGLDRLIGGGVWQGSTTLVVGPTGSGKTTIGLQFVLAGVAAGQPSLYINFQENPTQLAQAIANLGEDLESLRSRGLHLLYASSVELQIDRIIVDLFTVVERHGIRRVVLDAVGDLSLASSDPRRTQDYLYALVQQFAVAGITALFLLEDVSHGPMSSGAIVPAEHARLSYMCDNLILLEMRRGERLARRMSIYKTRGSAHDDAAHPMTISARGVRVE
jgi:circadian clock protein KaiC